MVFTELATLKDAGRDNLEDLGGAGLGDREQVTSPSAQSRNWGTAGGEQPTAPAGSQGVAYGE